MRLWKITRLRSWIKRFKQANTSVDSWKLLDWYDSLVKMLGRFRRFIDSEELIESNKTAQQQYETKFIDKILRAVDSTINQELLVLPDGSRTLPSLYYVFLAFEDDRLWFGSKRERIKKSLQKILLERASELLQQATADTNFALELLADPTLRAGEIWIKPVEDVDATDTKQSTSYLEGTADYEREQAGRKVSNLRIREG